MLPFVCGMKLLIRSSQALLRIQQIAFRMLEAVITFLAYIVEGFTGGVIENYSGTTCRQAISENSTNNDSTEVEVLVQGEALSDFTKFDPNDTVFQEFNPPPESCGKMAWKLSRPSTWKSLLQCFKTVFTMQFVFGSSIGLLAVAVILIDLNTADLCYEKTFNWDSIPPFIQSIRVTGQCVEGFFIEIWHFSIMLCMFGCLVMKELNLLTINLLAAFTDTCYRLFLQMYGIYKRPWMTYPLNVLSASLVIVNSLIIAKRIIPVQMYSRKTRCKVASLLALQLLFGFPIAWLLAYKIFPWYTEKSELQKVFIAALSPLIVCIPKAISRTAVTKLNLVHPGVLHLLVSTLYTASAVVFRVMQAELTSFPLFVALGVGHAVIDLLERLTVMIRDHIWEYMYKLMSRCNRSQTWNFRAGQARTPRSMRFVADVSIQLLLTEPTALVSSVGFIQLYQFMYPNDLHAPDEYFTGLFWQFLWRCLTGLAIDVFFNTISVWLQVMLFNIAVLRVWSSKNWRAHVTANAVCTVMVAFYFTGYLFSIVRGKHDGKTAKRFAFNCSSPFSKF